MAEVALSLSQRERLFVRYNTPTPRLWPGRVKI
jgi:hypothetical protein